VISVCSGMHTVDRHEGFRELLVGILVILVLYRVSAAAMWHLHWLVTLPSASDLHRRVL
jgi:hypothetical protein